MQRRYSIQMRKQEKQGKNNRKHIHDISRYTKSQIDLPLKYNQDRKDLGYLQASKKSSRLNQSRSQQKPVNINKLYKQRIIKERRSYSFVQKNKIENKNKNRFQSHKQSFNINEKDKKSITPDIVVLKFTSQCFNLQQKFIQNCDKNLFGGCFDCLLLLLNYTIDLQMPKWFLKVIHTISQFYQALQQIKNAMNFYQQLREASLLQKDYSFLVISLIGIARCAAQGDNLLNESVVILKKALQYAWYVNKIQLQLNVYDQLGERYYKMGEVQRAKIYHKKYSSSITEQKNSPLRLLSKQQIQKLQQEHLNIKYQNFSIVYLTHLNLPIKNSNHLQPLIPQFGTLRSKLQQNNKYLFEPHQLSYQVRRTLKSWIFQTETQQPNFENVRQIQQKNLHSQKKYAYSGLRMKRQIKPNQIKMASKINFVLKNQQGDQVKRKASLDDRVKKFVQQPGLSKNWYQNIVKQAKINQTRHLSHISDPVRVTKNTTKLKHKKETLKQLFKQTIQYFTSQKMKTLLITTTLLQANN